MADWKFGTILSQGYLHRTPVIMVIGKITEGGFQPSDGKGSMREGSWVGLTLVNEYGPDGWGYPGQTTWIMDNPAWEIVDD